MKIIDKKNIPLIRDIEDWEVKILIDNAEFRVTTMFDKCTIVACKLLNGFVLVESSGCINPDGYDEQYGIDCCCRRIIDKVYGLVGYNRQVEKYSQDIRAAMSKSNKAEAIAEEDKEEAENDDGNEN